MKKLLSLIALAVTIGFTSCSDDECDHKDCRTTENPIVGMWYLENDNEEINYDSLGTYYDRYSNVELSGEIEGKYELDIENQKLTYRYSYLGNNLQDNWTIKNITEFGLKLYSQELGSKELGKIVEKYKLIVGESTKLCFGNDRLDININSYSSLNERIASVTSDGTVTAMGEKGTTYIKINANVGNVWAKITVGEDNKDLWCDYVSIIGADYNTTKQYFSRIGEPATDGVDYFKYIMSIHQYIESVNILIDTERDFVTAIQLFIKEGVPPIEINSYLKSRFYEQEGYNFYSTQPEIEKSKALVTYNQENRCVTLLETQFVLYPELWHDFTKLFGSNKTSVKNAMDKYGYSFLMSDNSYSVDGSDYYYITDSDYLTMVGFVFNPDKQNSEIWLYLNSGFNSNEIYRYLAHKYNEAESESSDSSLVFYNDDKSMKVTFDVMDGTVVYNKQTMKQHKANNEILGNYYEALGLSQNQIISKYGDPYLDDGNMLYYVVGTDYINLAVFYMNTDTDKCKSVALTINENVASSTIVNYLGSKYTVFSNGTAADGSQYAWTNGPSVAESTLGVVYYPGDKMVVYQPLSAAANAKIRNMRAFSTKNDDRFINKVKSKNFSILDNVMKTRKSLKLKKNIIK